MQIPNAIIDDFKTDRRDILPPLPPSARLVPILFYGAIVASILLSILFILQIRISAARLDDHKKGLEKAEKSIQETRTERTALEEKILRANEVENWVEGTQPLQPLVVAIARSMDKDSSLLNMRIVRQETAPSQLAVSLRIGTETIAQLDRIIEAIQGQSYRIISPQQNVSRGQIDYHVTLVRQENHEEQPKEDSPPET